jgi:hypothetical protein
MMAVENFRTALSAACAFGCWKRGIKETWCDWHWPSVEQALVRMQRGGGQ